MAISAICLMGPTATGKTQLALALAKRLPCEIISVDSAMIYQGMDIGTAKPSLAEQAEVRHHLIDILDPKQSYSAAQFSQDANGIIKAVINRGKLPLLVGGTMLYFHALQQGLADLPDANPDIRAQLNKQLSQNGLPYLYERLQQVDAQAASKIHPHDPQRILRALEVFEATGTTISSYWQQSTPPSDVVFNNVVLMPRERESLHTAIAERFYTMLNQGFIDEVKQLYARDDLSPDLPALKTVGYRQALAYLAGELDYQSMQNNAIVATRRLAKRQMTWLRQWQQCHILEPGNTNNISMLERLGEDILG